MRALRLLAAASLVPFAIGCAGPGLYGHAKTYAPLADEEKAIAGAREYDPVMAVRQPEEWSKQPVSLFGVVTNRGATGGVAYLQISVRKLEPRNLCENAQDEDTCRVTVSDTEFGVVHAAVTLKGEDDVGEHSVGPGSLLRIVGQLGQDTDPNDGTPIIRATYYRHWPRHSFVTKAAASQMRQ
jgi:hypothetical protein